MQEKIRTFIAIPLPESLRDELVRTAQDAFGNHLHVRVVPGTNIHATLKFLGEINPENVERIVQGLKEISSRQQAFQMEVVGVGAFPDPRFPRVIFAAMAGDTERIVRLASEVDRMTAKLGAPPESRPYAPHLTIARVRSQKQLGLLRKRLLTLEDKRFGTFPVEEVVLYRSDLSPTGARYTPLAGARFLPESED